MVVFETARALGLKYVIRPFLHIDADDWPEWCCDSDDDNDYGSEDEALLMGKKFQGLSELHYDPNQPYECDYAEELKSAFPCQRVNQRKITWLNGRENAVDAEALVRPAVRMPCAKLMIARY